MESTILTSKSYIQRQLMVGNSGLKNVVLIETVANAIIIYRRLDRWKRYFKKWGHI